MSDRSPLKQVVDAWESLPGGRHHRPEQVERWLKRRMGPAIDQARVALKNGAMQVQTVEAPAPAPAKAIPAEALLKLPRFKGKMTMVEAIHAMMGKPDGEIHARPVNMRGTETAYFIMNGDLYLHMGGGRGVRSSLSTVELLIDEWELIKPVEDFDNPQTEEPVDAAPEDTISREPVFDGEAAE